MTDLYALSGQVSEDAGDEILEGRHNGGIKNDALADEHGNHLVVDLAILDRLEEPNRIALDNSAGRKGSPVSTKQSTQWPSPLRVPITKPYGKGYGCERKSTSSTGQSRPAAPPCNTANRSYLNERLDAFSPTPCVQRRN